MRQSIPPMQDARTKQRAQAKPSIQKEQGARQQRSAQTKQSARRGRAQYLLVARSSRAELVLPVGAGRPAAAALPPQHLPGAWLVLQRVWVPRGLSQLQHA